MLELKKLSFTAPADDADASSGSGGKAIINELDLTVSAGKIIAVTGPNGGGKSTLAKLISGVYEATGGQIIYNGEDITALDVTERAKKGISFGFQRPVAFKGFTVRDMINIAAGRELAPNELRDLLDKVGLCMHEYADREINASLSGGEQKRIEIATVLARNTKLDIFDEPEAGIDIWSFQRLISVFRELRGDRTKSQIIITHQKGILEIADEILVICGGEIVNRGTPDELLPNLFVGGITSCPVGRPCR
jgi:Fe-S cluster assembly ATP-binding protein